MFDKNYPGPDHETRASNPLDCIRKKSRPTSGWTSIMSIARRQAVETALASAFALVLISGSAPLPPKEKERRRAID
jgi:hypothetical protein